MHVLKIRGSYHRIRTAIDPKVVRFLVVLVICLIFEHINLAAGTRAVYMQEGNVCEKHLTTHNVLS